MSRHLPPFPASQIIVNDGPFLTPTSPSDTPWNQASSYPLSEMNTFGWNYYGLPPSPPNSDGSNVTDSPTLAHSMLKSRMTPESISDSEQQLSMPTHQVFDFSDIPSPSSAASPLSGNPPQLSLSIDTGAQGMKRSSTPAPGAIKKHRTAGERITCKDFIPPDVSGLSKREARLVKNRAAAFLSRQRKREEYEAMEIRVKELEEENARLLSIAQNGNGDDELLLEVEKLRSRLFAADKREQELRAELARKSIRDVAIKAEHYERSLSPSYSQSMNSSIKSGANLGLMQVLLCALPSLLSTPLKSTQSSTLSIPLPDPPRVSANSGSAFDHNMIPSAGYDWSPDSEGGAVVDLDLNDLQKSSTPPSKARRLEIQSEELFSLGGLDISFDTSPANNGKIRVRIHPSRGETARPSTSLRSNHNDRAVQSSSLSMWAGTDCVEQSVPFSSRVFSTVPPPPPAHPYARTSPSSFDSLEPFLGIGTTHSKFELDASLMAPMFDHNSTIESFGHASTLPYEYLH
ncbi:hypothetical protein BJ138DRAFT_1156432 [Hygrophoropsis aurantiaca]|uniref:Uncharacterized protein n=1 Tax=Hygrophoropsis aurantiaca TaxID=72124 RepID=A0ACB8A8A7_9AGAM|nr:hypothetical protein BJ138DRAFT_1156432 [Hygrophoropsis aurantiaca]